MTLGSVIRAGLVVVGFLLMLGGLGVIVGVGTIPGLLGLQMVASGAFLVVVVALERHRYRSETAERSHDATGPGGGEPAGSTLESRFRRTSEVFEDPTTGRTMRVVIDPATGERRYVAEG